MRTVKDILFKFLAEWLSKVIAPVTLVKTGQFVARAGRADYPNGIGTNGESLVQREILAQSGSEKITVVDCGANKGQWAKQLQSTYASNDTERQLNCFCFEPSKFTFDILLSELDQISSKTCKFSGINMALSSEAGELNLTIAHEGAGTNSLVCVPGSYQHEETVSVTTLDEFSRDRGLSRIDLLKIDAEGHDFDVILGARQLLEEGRIGAIQFEYNWRWIYGQHFLEEVFSFLKPLGYDLGKVTPNGIQFYEKYDVALETFVEGNYLACKKESSKDFGHFRHWLV